MMFLYQQNSDVTRVIDAIQIAIAGEDARLASIALSTVSNMVSLNVQDQCVRMAQDQGLRDGN